MGNLVQAAAVAVVGTLCALSVRKQTPDIALVLTLGAICLLAVFALRTLDPVRDMLENLAQQAGLSAAVLEPVVKTVGIALLTRVTAELCRDGGESALGAAVEIAGGACALAICLPLIEAVLELLLELL